MSRKVVIASLVALAVCLMGAAESGTASDSRQVGKRESLRTQGTYRYYGYPEYRCREFSSVCGYIRPVYYGQYWSTTYAVHKSAKMEPDSPAKLARHFVENIRDEAQVTVPVEQSGGFTRMEAPGNATRWVRSNTFMETK